jgi:hypothetical protein
MKFIYFSVCSAVWQAVCLEGFILISRSRFSDFGKPFVLGITTLGIALLLWRGIKNASSLFSVCFLPIVLALGYIFAFNFVGEVAFPGLLSYAHYSTIDTTEALLRVTTNLLLIYVPATALFFVLTQLLRNQIGKGAHR